MTPPRTHDSRLARNLFVIYLIAYTSFILISALAPSWMETRVTASLNLAVVYGVGLIVAAFVLAMLYGLRASDASQP
jgi:uncharacterized membrane protein (DUF485 family)